MMDETTNTETPDAVAATTSSAKPSKANLTKTLPTDRVSFEKQMQVLRAYAAASGPEKKAVNNDEVASVLAGLAASSISLCNPFFSDSDLLIQDGRKQRPADAVFDYHHAYEWNPDTAATKLGRVLSETWGAKTLLPKLSFRQLTKDEAISFLADESKATKAHRKNLEVLLEFLNAAGVIRLEGNTVLKVSAAAVPMLGPPQLAGGGPDVNGKDAPKNPIGQSGAASGSGAADAMHPFIRGLLDKLPSPETDWPMAGRAKWLQTAANIFDLIYTNVDASIAEVIEVKLKKELSS